MLRLLGMGPFTLLGVISNAVLVLTASGVLPATGVWLMLMLPAYLVRLVVVMVAVALLGEPHQWLTVALMPLQLVPFAACDYLLARASRAHRVTSASR
jgi:hypothetical protein